MWAAGAAGAQGALGGCKGCKPCGTVLCSRGGTNLPDPQQGGRAALGVGRVG